MLCLFVEQTVLLMQTVQVEAFDRVALRLYGAFAYLLWRSVYITKQVSFR